MHSDLGRLDWCCQCSDVAWRGRPGTQMPSTGHTIDLADSGRFLGQHGHAESVQAEGHSTANGLDQRLFSGPAIKEGLIAFVTRQRSQLGRFVMGKKILRNKQCIRHGTHGFQVDTDFTDLRAPTDGEQQAVTARRGVEDIRSGFETWFAIGIEAEHNFRWLTPLQGCKQTLDQPRRATNRLRSCSKAKEAAREDSSGVRRSSVPTNAVTSSNHQTSTPPGAWPKPSTLCPSRRLLRAEGSRSEKMYVPDSEMTRTPHFRRPGLTS